MKARTILFGIMLLSLLCAIAIPASAQTAKPAVASHQQSADAAARKQLAAYMANFRSDPTNTELRDKIIDLAKTLKPAPAVPQAARTAYATATAQLDRATTPEEFTAAASSFEQVAAQAPWWASVYLNAAKAYTKAADLENAKRDLALYRRAIRSGVNTGPADDLQAEIDRQQAMAVRQQFQQALQAFQSNPSDAAREHIIKLAQALPSKPELPDAVHDVAGRAAYSIKGASSDADFLSAAENFGKATQLAPWVPDYYFNQGVAYEKAKRYNEAIAAYRWYLMAAPNANDVDQVRERIGGLKYSKEQADQEQRAAAAHAAYEASPEGIAKKRQKAFEDFLTKIDHRNYRTDHGQEITVYGRHIAWCTSERADYYGGSCTEYGNITGIGGDCDPVEIQGYESTCQGSYYQDSQNVADHFTFTISEDGETITQQWRRVETNAYGEQPPGDNFWTYHWFR